MRRNTFVKKWQIMKYLKLIRSAYTKESSLNEHVIFGGDIEQFKNKNSLGQVLLDRLRDPSRADKIIQVIHPAFRVALLKMKKLVINYIADLSTKKRNSLKCTQVSVETGNIMTTGTFVRQSVAVAESLREYKIEKGDYILIAGKNSLNMNVALTGIFLSGAVAVPISHYANSNELRPLLLHIKPKFFICDDQQLFFLRRIIKGILGEIDFEAKAFLLNDSASLNSRFKCFPEFIHGKGKNLDSFQPVTIKNPEEELILVIKSLREGPSIKGIGLTHSNLLAILNRYEAKKSEVMPSRVILMVQKMIWMSGIYSLLLSCYFGSKMIVMRKYGEEAFMRAVEIHGVTTCYLYPIKLWGLYKYKYPTSYKAASCTVHAVGFGIPHALIQGAKDKLGLNVIPSYSVAEMSGIVVEPEKNYKKGSTGKLIPLCYAKVVSTTTNQVFGPLTPGELCFKGPTMMKKYVNDEKASKDLIDKDGFLHSGDYGYYDEENNFFVLDKLKQIIRYKDHEISPLEIEGIIKSLEYVKDCVVSGIPHPFDGYHIAALVELQPGKEAAAEEIIKLVEGTLPEHKHLKAGVIFIPKVPRSRESGFIKRNAVKKVLDKFRLITDSEKLKESKFALEKQKKAKDRITDGKEASADATKTKK